MSRRGLLESPPPDVAIEIDSTHVEAVRLAWRGADASIAAQAMEALPAGAVIPALAAPNVLDPGAVGRAVSQAMGRLGGRVRRAALVLPDTVAKVSLVRFDTVPARAADLGELIRWQMRKSAPFPLEQAVVSYTPGIAPPEGGREFVVTVARTDIVEQYERACEQAGVHCGLVDLATFSVINAALAGPALPGGGGRATRGDWLLVHAEATYTTLTVLRGSDLIFYRNRAEDAEGTLADVVHQTAMYYEDRLKGEGFARVLLAGSEVGGNGGALRANLQDRLGSAVEVFEPAARPSVTGILLRERRAA